MNLLDIIKNANTYIGDSSTDRLSQDERYQAVTEATSWLLEELGNEHMVDRVNLEYIPTVLWQAVDNLTPYLLTAGQLRFKEETPDRIDFTRVEARDLASSRANKYAYAIERYDGDSYIGIVMPEDSNNAHTNIVEFNQNDGLTYTGINAAGQVAEPNAIRFEMANTGVTSTGLSTVVEGMDFSSNYGDEVMIVEVEIPDMEDVTSISLIYGLDLTTNYYLQTVTTDINGNALKEGLNILRFRYSDFTTVGTPGTTDLVAWKLVINHDVGKPVMEGIRFSDLRITRPVQLTFKYIFYRVGKNAAGTEIIEFTADTDVPFFIERYPQYRFAVAHKAASVLYRSLQNMDSSQFESKEATKALDRYRKNFSGERDMANSQFKVAGINLRRRGSRGGRRIIN